MKFMRNGLIILTVLSLFSEMLPRGGGGRGGGGRGGGGHHGGSFRGGGSRGYGHHGYRGYGHHGYRRGGIGLGLGLGGLALGISYSNWYYGGWNNWNNGWWNAAPYWYAGTDWYSLSLEGRLNLINNQIATLKTEAKDGNSDAQDQLDYLIRRRDQLARQL